MREASITHYGVIRAEAPGSPMIKEAEFFVEQGGLTKPWGAAWKPIHGATSIGDARRQFAAENRIVLSSIYKYEP